MAQDSFPIAPEVLKHGMAAGLYGFVSDTGAAVAAQSAELVEKGCQEAYFVPAVRFLIDATLEVVGHTEVEKQLSREVADRQMSASHLAGHFANLAGQQRLFEDLYSRHPALRNVSPPEGDIESLNNTEYISSLGRAPFFDVRVVGGGALRALEAKSVANPVEVIKRSRGLLSIAGVYKHPDIVELVHNCLGLPYVEAMHLRVVERDNQVEVDFNSSVQTLLKGLHVEGRGCPAGKITSPTEPGNQLLHDYWSRIVDYLIPSDATVLAT